MGETARIDVVAVAGATEVRLHGDIDLEVEQEVVSTICDLAATGQQVVVDMSEVTFIDSAGLRALVIGVNACTDAGTTLAVQRPSEPVRRVLQVSGIDATLIII